MLGVPSKNPVLRLLKGLPKSMAKQKREAIRQELTAIGRYQHYRQCVLRPDWEMIATQFGVADVLMRELGISREFFTGSEQDRAAQVESIVKQCGR